MLEELGVRRGVSPAQLDETMTRDQILLAWHWAQRADSRRVKLDEIGITRAIAVALGGSAE